MAGVDFLTCSKEVSNCWPSPDIDLVRTILTDLGVTEEAETDFLGDLIVSSGVLNVCSSSMEDSSFAATVSLASCAIRLFLLDGVM